MTRFISPKGMRTGCKCTVGDLSRQPEILMSFQDKEQLNGKRGQRNGKRKTEKPGRNPKENREAGTCSALNGKAKRHSAPEIRKIQKNSVITE